MASAVLPIDERVDRDWTGFNQRIRELNEGIKSLCEAESPKCAFVNAGPSLIDSSGNLAEQYHDGDGVHLTAEGDRIWIQALKPVVMHMKEMKSGTKRSNSSEAGSIE